MLGDVATIDEPQLEHANCSAATDRERTRLEAPHDRALHAENDDDADPHSHAHVAKPERSRRQEDERRMVARGGMSRRGRAHVKDALRAGADPHALRAQAKPFFLSARRPHLRPSAR
jgi:hypothetical protein